MINPFKQLEIIKTEVFTSLPQKFRKKSRTAWSDPNRQGAEVECFLEGPSFDRQGNLYCVDIPFGRVFRISPKGDWELVIQYDGWPNGLKFHKDGRAFIACYKKGLLVLDTKTGKLQLLKYDSNGNGTVDTWSYMDGVRILRIEIDADEDGKLDRWEHYGADQKLEKVGLSPSGDGKATRTEWHEQDVLVRAEEDTDEDGRTDKWETYENGRLTAVAFDTLHRGTPDRRLIYGPDGSVRVDER